MSLRKLQRQMKKKFQESRPLARVAIKKHNDKVFKTMDGFREYLKTQANKPL